MPRRAAQFFQLIKTGSALTDVGEQMGQLSIHGLLGKLPKDFAPWAVNAPRIREVFMHDAVKGVEELFFNIHSARPIEHGVQRPTAMFTMSRIPRS